MGIHTEKSLYSLTLGEIQREKDRVAKGYHSKYYKEIKGNKGNREDNIYDSDGDRIRE